jgi:LuxR family maltose regulon positive regulatory protein
MPPRLRSSTIQRQDLMKRLDSGLNGKLILLSAPTGFGKTTLVNTWIANRDFPSAWVTLDENDNDPSRFWTYFVSALRTFDPAIGKTIVSFLIQNLPDALHLVLITRTHPDLPLALLRARSELLAMDTHDLRFSAQEAGDFLREATHLNPINLGILFLCLTGGIWILAHSDPTRRDK